MAFIKIPQKVDEINDEFQNSDKHIIDISEENKQQQNDLKNISAKVRLLANKFHAPEALNNQNESESFELQDLNKTIFKKLLEYDQLAECDKSLRLTNVDSLIACLAGGSAVLIDFLAVGIPKNMKFTNKGETYNQEGSSLTKLLHQIGKTEDGNEAKWVCSLEKWFKVPYDKSIDPLLKHFCPKNHRAFSLGHEPSLSGFIWSVKDIICGTFSSIDRDGILHIEKVSDTNYLRLFYAPILWLGHIVSDIFTTMGVPIPGNSFLRLLQFGSIGDKERTIAKISEEMFLDGYDLRHFATMSLSNAVIFLVISIYFILTKSNTPDGMLFSENEYNTIKLNQKKYAITYIAYSVAVSGNIAKVALYHGNPNAINASIWIKFIKESIRELEIVTRDKSGEKAIENRHAIDENFEVLLQNLK